MASAIAEEVIHEIDRSEEEYGAFHSLHEGLSVLRAEYKELEDAIFWGISKDGDTSCVRSNAIHVAAMATKIAMMISPIPVDLPVEHD